MIVSKLRKSGNSFIITVPREEVERLHLKEGQLVALEVRQVDVRPRLAPHLEAMADELIDKHAPALRYLAGDAP